MGEVMKSDAGILTEFDKHCMDEAFAQAQAADAGGNLPIGCVIALGGKIIARGQNRILHPAPNPWKHAECDALSQICPSQLAHLDEMTLYTTLEPCIMCMGTLVLHEIGRVIYGATDVLGGGAYLMQNLPPFYNNRRVPRVFGPVDAQRCDALYAKADSMFPKCKM